jgi:hypothetical protein
MKDKLLPYFIITCIISHILLYFILLPASNQVLQLIKSYEEEDEVNNQHDVKISVQIVEIK